MFNHIHIIQYMYYGMWLLVHSLTTMVVRHCIGPCGKKDWNVFCSGFNPNVKILKPIEWGHTCLSPQTGSFEKCWKKSENVLNDNFSQWKSYSDIHVYSVRTLYIENGEYSTKTGKLPHSIYKMFISPLMIDHLGFKTTLGDGLF